MSNSIWKTPDQKPDSRKQILIYDGVDYSIEISHPEYWEDKGLIEKWCYWDEFVAQADKAERLQIEVDLLEHNKNGWAKLCEQKQEQIQRLQKAVDYALQVLDDVIEIGGIDLAMIKIEQMIKE